MNDLNTEILRVARTWIGTPSVHGAACKGVGADCVGLARGVWSEATGHPLPKTGAIAPDWHLEKGAGAILRAANDYADKIEKSDAKKGDFVLFRVNKNAGPQHLAIISEMVHGTRLIKQIIHADSHHGVVETSVSPSMLSGIVAILRAQPV